MDNEPNIKYEPEAVIHHRHINSKRDLAIYRRNEKPKWENQRDYIIDLKENRWN